ncbi:hypothetical protein H0N95_02395 [Candidatus Micrarchaeota archaeon]|nr:hypothetical protein [Candidatus Micrarchaeota archaeon]
MKFGFRKAKQIVPWEVRVKKINPASGLSKGQAGQLYKEILERGKGETIGWRAGFHPEKRIQMGKVGPEGDRIRVKGGFLIGEGDRVSKFWKERIEKAAREGSKIERGGFASGAEGFVDKEHSSKEYALGNRLFKKCPEVMANVPFALIEFPNIKTKGRIFPEKQRAIMQAVPEESKRVLEVHESQFGRGNYKEAFKTIVNSMAELSGDKEKHLKLKELLEREKAGPSDVIWAKRIADVMPEYRQRVVNEARKNLSTVYEKTGHIPDVAYGAKDITANGKLADFGDFERSFSRKTASGRIDYVINSLDENLKRLEMSAKKGLK